MRITQNMLSRGLLDDLQGVTERLARTQSKLSSGKELTAPSDDPFAASRALLFRSDIAQNQQYQQYQRNVDEALAWQSITDTSLAKVGDLVLRARDLLVQGANDSSGAGARSSIAIEIDQIAEAIKSEGSAKYAGRFVFSGSATLTQPYQMGATDTYSGNTELVKREIGPGVQVDLNVPGSSVIGDASSGLLEVLRNISADLRANDGAKLRNVDIAALDTAHDALTAARSVVGARTNRLETAASRLQEIQETSNKLLSDTEDADMAKTLVDYSTQQAVYQSALKSGANLIQPSLMDFLR